MQPADRKANPHCYPAIQITPQPPAASSWLGRVVVRVREHFAPAPPLALGVPHHLRGDIVSRENPPDASVERHSALGIEFSNPASAQEYRTFVARGGIGIGARRGAITGQEPQPE
jgi:hypothetical protein